MISQNRISGTRLTQLALLWLTACAASVPKPARQNPSPMVESTRVHQRVEKRELSGVHYTIDGILPKPVEVFVPPSVSSASSARLLIHFMGASYLPFLAGAESSHPTVVAAIHLGAGSRVYESPFASNSDLFSLLLDAIRKRLPIPIDRIHLSAFSAGYGSVRAILRSEENVRLIEAVLLLDGLHTGYLPEEKPVAEGGQLDVAKLQPFLDFARRASAGQKHLVITHSEVFPGTFASTTETADYLLRELSVKRMPVLQWGPMGMQQLSEARQGNFVVLGFAGNSAPDHLDHFHAMSAFLRLPVDASK